MNIKNFDSRQSTAIMASETDFKHNQPERLFLRATIYIINCDNIYDLLVSANPSKTMTQRGIRVDSYIDKLTYVVQTKITGL